MEFQIETFDSLEEQFGEPPIQEYPLYDGRILLKYEDSAHKYFLDTEEGRVQVPNATSVLGTLDKSNVLIPWAVRKCITKLESLFEMNNYPGTYRLPDTRQELEDWLEQARKEHRVNKDNAADIGKIAHNWLERYGKLVIAGYTGQHIFNHNPLPTNPNAANCVKAVLKWFEEHHVVFLECERKVYSMEDNACGTADVIAMVDGKLSLLDYKSSKYVYDEHRFQTAFYKSAYEQETGRKIEQRILIRMDKETGEFEPHTFADEGDYRADLMAFKGLLITYERVQELKAEAAAEKAAKKAAAKAIKEAAKTKK